MRPADRREEGTYAPALSQNQYDGNGVPATMKAMYEAAPEPKALKIFPGTVHGTDIFFAPQGDEFRDLLVGFLEDLLRE